MISQLPFEGIEKEKMNKFAKMFLALLFLIFAFTAPVMIFGVMDQAGMFATLDPFTILFILFIPILIAVGVVYAIWKSDSLI